MVRACGVSVSWSRACSVPGLACASCVQCAWGSYESTRRQRMHWSASSISASEGGPPLLSDRSRRRPALSPPLTPSPLPGVGPLAPAPLPATGPLAPAPLPPEAMDLSAPTSSASGVRAFCPAVRWAGGSSHCAHTFSGPASSFGKIRWREVILYVSGRIPGSILAS